jgi:hypothetical protein
MRLMTVRYTSQFISVFATAIGDFFFTVLQLCLLQPMRMFGLV